MIEFSSIICKLEYHICLGIFKIISSFRGWPLWLSLVLPLVITMFPRGVRPFVRPSVSQNLAKQNNSQVRIVISTGGTVGLAEWIIDGTYVLF